jgi:hypothetical protein
MAAINGEQTIAPIRTRSASPEPGRIVEGLDGAAVEIGRCRRDTTRFGIARRAGGRRRATRYLI